MTQDVLTRGPAVTLADVEHASAGEPEWLREKRRAAWRLYESMDFPDAGDEEWRRTDVRAIPVEGLAPSPAATSLPDAGSTGVVVSSLLAAAREHEALVREHLYAAVTPGEWRYLALNAALWGDGAFVYVPDNADIDVPLQLTQTLPSGEAAVFPRTLIIAGRNSRVRIVDESVAPDRVRGFVSAAVEIFVGDGAQVEYYDINGLGDETYNFKTVRAILGRDASFTGMAAGIGSKLTKMRIDSEMPEQGARTELLGVTFANGDQHFDYNTLQNHIGHHTISDLQFKSALADRASLIWYGITRINPTAGGSEANQTSRNLLLSEHAKAAPIPILEIEAWDVAKCSHGATAGPVEEEELFYLQARGIPARTAEQMLVEGFFADVVSRIPSAPLRERVMDAVLAKAGGHTEMLTFEELMSA